MSLFSIANFHFEKISGYKLDNAPIHPVPPLNAI